MCGGRDAVGLDRPVFVDRYCDNYSDCANGSDEDGSIIQCDLNPTENGCCGTYVMDDEEFVYGGINRGRDYFNNTNPNSDNKHLVFIPTSLGDTWLRVKLTLDDIETQILYSGLVISSSFCPPSNVTWISGSGRGITPPKCKNVGRILTDYCAQNNCHTDADCTNNLESFTCTCKYGFVGDGVNCEALPVENECATGNNLCDRIGGVCTDTKFSYTCSCDTGFWDVNQDNPGHECNGCCETVDLIKQDSIYTSCTLNTHKVSKGGDKWVYECDRGDKHLEYFSEMKYEGYGD